MARHTPWLFWTCIALLAFAVGWMLKIVASMVFGAMLLIQAAMQTTHDVPQGKPR